MKTDISPHNNYSAAEVQRSAPYRASRETKPKLFWYIQVGLVFWSKGFTDTVRHQYVPLLISYIFVSEDMAKLLEFVWCLAHLTNNNLKSFFLPEISGKPSQGEKPALNLVHTYARGAETASDSGLISARWVMIC